MKTKLFFTALVLMLSVTASYASFPVLRTEKPIVDTEINTNNFNSTIADANKELLNNNVTEVYTAATVAAKEKDLVVGILLWFFLGGLAGHRWYYGKPIGWNILFILTAGGLGVWWIIDLINMIGGNF